MILSNSKKYIINGLEKIQEGCPWYTLQYRLVDHNEIVKYSVIQDIEKKTQIIDSDWYY